MADSIISQFKREYAAPIETDRQVANIGARNAIASLTRWEGMQVYVVSEQTTYELKGGITDPYWSPLGSGSPSSSGYIRWRDYRLYKESGGSEIYPEIGDEIQGRGDGSFYSGEWIHGEINKAMGGSYVADNDDIDIFTRYP